MFSQKYFRIHFLPLSWTFPYLGSGKQLRSDLWDPETLLGILTQAPKSLFRVQFHQVSFQNISELAFS
jgi:hypothetical protein